MRSIRVNSFGPLFGMLLSAALVVMNVLESTCARANPNEREAVVLRVRSEAVVRQSIVRIADIAVVTGGEASRRQQIGQLDLDEIEGTPGQIEIRRSRVALRLQLAGINTAEFKLTGSQQTVVRRQHRILDDHAVLTSLREPLASAWNVPDKSLRIRLDQPLMQCLPKGLDLTGEFRLEPFVPANTYPGRLRLTVGLYRQEQLADTFSIPITVHVEQLAATARRSIKAGEQLTISNVTFHRQRRTGPKATQTVGSNVLGQYAAKPLRPNQTLTRLDVTETRVADDSPKPKKQSKVAESKPQRVRARSLVTLVAKRGSWRVVVHQAELISAANIGDAVRVRNLESKRIVVGQLVNPNEVEVRF